jgi:diadenylate cyclase
VVSRSPKGFRRALTLVAPGSPLREGVDRILLAKMGALLVVGDSPEVLAICSGGFLLDAEFSPQRLSELAKMDGAILLSSDGSRIARANVHLLPDSGVPTTETGTRHRTAERVARSVDVPVIAVSEEMSIISVYSGEAKRQLEPLGQILERTGQAIQTLERFRQRLDGVLAEVARHEVDDNVTVRDVAIAFQRGEMVRRLGEELEALIVELGDEGRLARLQQVELLAGVGRELHLLHRDYRGKSGKSKDPLAALEHLSSDDVADLDAVANAVGLIDHHGKTASPLHEHLHPRGLRILLRIPRLSEAVAEHVADHFADITSLRDATVQQLTRVEGVGDVRARTIRDGLNRVIDNIHADVRAG